MSASEVGGFELRRVFAVAGAALRARWAPMLAFSLLLSFAPAVAQHLIPGLGVPVSVRVNLPPDAPAATSAAALAASHGHLGPTEAFLDIPSLPWAWQVFSWVCGTALAGALASLTFSSVDGDQAPWRRTSRDLWINLIPLTLISLVSTALVLLGVLVLVPGMIMFAAWMVAGPVQVAERLGVRGSLTRSAQLTRGRRWLILGLVAIVAVGFVISGVIATAVTNALRPGVTASDFVSPVIGTLLSLVYDVVAAALYLELRRVKDGIGLGAVDEVFG